MKRYFIRNILLLSLAVLSPTLSMGETIAPEYFAQIPVTTPSPIISQGPLDKANAIVEKGHEALHYIGRDAVVDSLNYVSDSANNLVNNGVKVDHTLTVQKTLIPQIGFGLVGILASTCGLAVLTKTALQQDQKNTKAKYIAGSGMLMAGLASLYASYWLSK